jgi:Raf kinase inhibitor-like YbhB/YbcL family protein
MLGACGGDNEPLPNAPATMRLASPAFQNGGTIPKLYTCSGAGTSPPLAILDVPAKARELALIVEDRDADNFLHWAVFDISPDTAIIRGAQAPAGSVEAKNDFGKPGWGPPCPPKGDMPHHYVFAIYALDGHVTDRDQIADHALARGTLTGRFSR